MATKISGMKMENHITLEYKLRKKRYVLDMLHLNLTK